jgi:hypothetical protein
MEAREAQKIIDVFYQIDSNKVETSDIDIAYSYLPIQQPYANTIRKIQAINRYVTFNRDILDYTIANSDQTINEVESHVFNMVTPSIDDILEDMPTELINNQSGNGKEVGEYQLEAPATKSKNKGGRPKGSKTKAKGKRK